jgi:hypothetical protein
MSWSIWLQGRTRDVRRELTSAKRQTFSIDAEQRTYDAALVMAQAALDQNDDDQLVFLQLSGSAAERYEGKEYRRGATGNVLVSVAPYPSTVAAPPMETWCEPEPAAAPVPTT